LLGILANGTSTAVPAKAAANCCTPKVESQSHVFVT
jgi:hypothetical protein